MKTKTFKIGESCKGGIITVEIQGKIVTVIGKEWGTEKEFTRGSAIIGDDDPNVYLKIDKFLNDLTTSYYSGKVLEWVTSNSSLQKQLFWK